MVYKLQIKMKLQVIPIISNELIYVLYVCRKILFYKRRTIDGKKYLETSAILVWCESPWLSTLNNSFTFDITKECLRKDTLYLVGATNTRKTFYTDLVVFNIRKSPCPF